jgi:hypothetical protein
MTSLKQEIAEARMLVALAPNIPKYRRQLDALLTKASGALRDRKRPLEKQRLPQQASLPGVDPLGSVE